MLQRKIETLLFLAGRPLSVKKLCELTEEKRADVYAASEQLVKAYEERKGGLLIQKAADSYQMVPTLTCGSWRRPTPRKRFRVSSPSPA